ncbi:glycosyltransferase [bacterium]|nr:glycosyltransferase [bacterium]
MKILVISHSAVVGLYREKFHVLAGSGCDLHLALPASWPEGGRWVQAPRPGREKGARLHVLAGRFLGRVGGFHLPGLGRLIKEIKPEIIHVEEEPYSLVCWQAFYHARCRNVPILFFTWENILRKYKIPLDWIYKHSLSQANWVLAGNCEAENVLRGRGYKGPCAVIPQYGVDPEKFRPRPEISKIKKPAYTIGYFGRLREEKGLYTLVHAVARLDFPSRLIIAGCGEYEKRLKQQIKSLNPRIQVEFLGVRDNDQMPWALNQLEVLVLPSETRAQWKEQFGRILIEAMACEIPVIGSDSGEIPHVIGEAGMIFPEGNVRQLAECITKLHAAPARARKLARCGRQRVIDKFTTDCIARQTLEVYRKILERGK